MGDFSLNSQLSTSQMVSNSHLGGVEISGLCSTAIPFREQLRCRRFWFFYHDLRAFTTSVSLFYHLHKTCNLVFVLIFVNEILFC